MVADSQGSQNGCARFKFNSTKNNTKTSLTIGDGEMVLEDGQKTKTITGTITDCTWEKTSRGANGVNTKNLGIHYYGLTAVLTMHPDLAKEIEAKAEAWYADNLKRGDKYPFIGFIIEVPDMPPPVRGVSINPNTNMPSKNVIFNGIRGMNIKEIVRGEPTIYEEEFIEETNQAAALTKGALDNYWLKRATNAANAITQAVVSTLTTPVGELVTGGKSKKGKVRAE